MLDRFYKFKSLNVPDAADAPRTKAFLPWVWFFVKPYKVELFIYNLVHLARYIYFMCAVVFFTKIAELFEQGRVQDDLRQPLMILAVFFVLNVICFLCWVFIHRRMSICDKISREMSMFAVRHYMRMPLSWHELSGSGGKMQRIVAARKGLFDLFENYFWDVSDFVAIFVSLFVSVYVMDMPNYFIIPLALYVTTYIAASYYTGKWLLKPTNRYYETLEDLSTKVYEFVNSIATVKLFNLHRFLMTEGARKELISHSAMMDAAKLRGLRWALTDMLAVCWITGVAAFSIYEVHHGNMSISAFILVTLFMLTVWDRLASFTRIFAMVVESYTAVKRLIISMSMQPSIVSAVDAQPLKVTKANISIHDVSFLYGDVHEVFENLNLNIAAGEKVGLLGQSGAGKTSLIKLLLRFYDVSAGEICIDGQNIKDVDLDSLRQNIAIIPQDISLFNHSVLDNIRYGCIDASDAEVIEAAKKAHAHEFIESLPEGYQTMVGERGVRLSGGQRQRIAIARAILKDAPILILDEATSALDSESERLIQESLEELMKGKTVIAIAHRLSTIHHLDRLIVMEDGAILEQGTHQELVDKEGVYAKLWTMQSGGFIGD